MKKKWLSMQVAGVEISATRLALVCSALLWVALAMAGIFAFDLTPLMAVWGGFLAMGLHWAGETLHQYGHVYAARRTGYPMREMRMLHLLTISMYPRDEPELPAEIHIRRALGGPAASLAVALAGGGLLWWMRGEQGLAYLLTQFFFLENLLVFCLGALLPLGFTDGSTLLKWWPRRGRS